MILSNIHSHYFSTHLTMDSTSGRSNLALTNFSQDSSFSNRILIYGSLRSIVHFIKYTNKNFKTRSEESCGFYKSSNGESYQNELTGVRNLFLTPVFEALKVRDPRLEPVSHYSFYEDIRNDSKERNLH